MPVVSIVCNQSADAGHKHDLLRAVTELFSAECNVPAGHVHVHLCDGAAFSFGGSEDVPGALITVKCSALQILPEQRKQLLVGLCPLLSAAFGPGLVPDHITTFFEDLPVERIAVGTSIAIFAKSTTTVVAGRASLEDD